MTVQPLKTDTNNIALVSAQLATLPQLAAGISASAQPHGTMRVTPDPTSIFYDSFPGAVLDTVDRWGVTGTAPVQAGGLLTFPAGTISTTSILISKPVIPVTASQFVFPAFVVKIEAAVGTGVGRFWGLGTPPTTPSPTSLAQDAAGFELDSVTGAFQAVTYTAGVKTVIATLTRPTDGLLHRPSMQYRNSLCFWFFDNINVPVASSTFLNTSIQDMFVLISSVSGATLTNAPTLAFSAAGVSDLARQATQIADGLFPWRKVSVGKSGGLSVKGVSIPVVNGTFAAAAVGTVGPVDVSEAGNGTFIIKNSVAASPFGAGGVVVFEQSDDAVSWAPLVVMRQDGVSTSTATLGANTANASTMYDCALEGVNFVRVRLTTAVTTNGVSINIQASGMPFAPIVSVYPLPAGTNTIGALVANQSVNKAQINGVAPLMGNGVSGTGSQRVNIASDNAPLTVNLSKAATAAVTPVPSAVTATTLLAANTARVGAVFFNDSTSTLYLKWGAAPTITSFTAKVLAGGYYELPGPIVYNGLITGLWATANGNLLVTEVTP